MCQLQALSRILPATGHLCLDRLQESPTNPVIPTHHQAPSPSRLKFSPCTPALYHLPGLGVHMTISKTCCDLHVRNKFLNVVFRTHILGPEPISPNMPASSNGRLFHSIPFQMAAGAILFLRVRICDCFEIKLFLF